MIFEQVLCQFKRQASPEASAYCSFYWVLQIYAASFFVVPMIRWVLNAARNRQIEERNSARTAAQQLLKAPNAALKRKLNRSREEAKHRRITDADVIYRSDREQGEQAHDLEAEDFDRRLGQAGRQPARAPASHEGGDALARVRQLFRDSNQVT